MNKELNLELYKKLFLIRRSEERIIDLYFDNDMKTPMHMSMGAEAIAAGTCHAVSNDDQVFGTYRSHAIYLAKTLDSDNFFAEMYGKVNSIIEGKGGSMHLCSPEHGFMGTSAIVSSIIPVAMGAAFVNKRLNNGKMVFVFFGDGAVDEGVFWESLNVASLMKLPIVFVCEDNNYAVHSHKSTRCGYESIDDIVNKFNCLLYQETTTDAEKIYELTKKVISNVKEKQQPAFLHLNYYRYLEHVGISEDFKAGYRDEKEALEWKENDPILLQRKKIEKSGILNKEIVSLEKEVENKIEKSIAEAQRAKFAGISSLMKGVFK